MKNDRIYFARRAAEEQELALAATDPQVAETHRQMQRAYLERASTGDRKPEAAQPIGSASLPFRDWKVRSSSASRAFPRAALSRA